MATVPPMTSMTAMPTRITDLLALGVARVVAPELLYRPRSADDSYDLDYQSYSEYLQGAINSGSPFVSARLGSTEALNCLAYLRFRAAGERSSTGGGSPQNAPHTAPHTASKTPWQQRLLRPVVPSLQTFSGVFPSDQQTVDDFCWLYLDALSSVDVLASWIQQEDALADYFSAPQRVFLEDIVPFVGDNPWTSALAGKRVLVIHPFKQSIEQQYARRKLLFADPRVLPAFDLIAYQAVQSLGGQEESVHFCNWFAALQHMQDDIADIDFDVAIVGCGAYGLPLAAHIKQLGKPAIHLGGVTQCLFGIKGKRWEEQYDWDTRYFNQYWVYPAENERPSNADAVEGACYWGDTAAESTPAA